MTITITGGMTFTGGVSATVGPPVTATYLVVAGGGGGGANNGGGGGAGGYQTSTITLGSGSTYAITVGAGGAGSTGQSGPTLSKGSNGSNSSVAALVVSLGGGGAGGEGTGNGYIANDGGSGGGAGNNSSVTGYGLGTAGQGNNGGQANNTTNSYPGGGGGGASAVGGNASGGTAGSGGSGSSSSISGSSITYAGGGGGASWTAGGSGGAGGGGAGATGNGAFGGTAGTANLGGGGGGGTGANGAQGGSGIVIVAYSGAPQFSGGVITSSGGNTIHSFYTSGTLQSGASLITNSLRFRSSASAYLTRTPSSSGNAQKYTQSFWFKGGNFTTGQLISAWAAGATLNTTIRTTSNGMLQYYTYNNTSGLFDWFYETAAVYRDPAAWYHIVLAIDTTQATSANRVILYINGVQVTAYSSATQAPTAPSLNYSTGFNVSGNPNYVGVANSTGGFSQPVEGYLTDVYLIDGQQLTPQSFAATNSTTGQWQSIAYTGTYGTNGFHLPFTKTISTAALGTDTSGNNNTFTVNNFSLTSGVTYDSVTDVPTLTNASVSNYCVYNILNNNGTITNGSLRFSNTAGTYASCSGTMGMSNGKYYWEVTITAYSPSGTLVGITASTEVWTGVASYIGSTAGSYGYYNGGTKYNNAASTSYGSSWTTGDVIGVTYDTSTGTLTFYKNNVSQGTAYSGLTGTFMPGVSAYNNGTPLLDINFGQQPFVYTPPLGYVQLNAYNM
jgi:SPRY domain/Concanavalin A-like lectin/glucanases superfamily